MIRPEVLPPRLPADSIALRIQRHLAAPIGAPLGVDEYAVVAAHVRNAHEQPRPVRKALVDQLGNLQERRGRTDCADQALARRDRGAVDHPIAANRVAEVFGAVAEAIPHRVRPFGGGNHGGKPALVGFGATGCEEGPDTPEGECRARPLPGARAQLARRRSS